MICPKIYQVAEQDRDIGIHVQHRRDPEDAGLIDIEQAGDDGDLRHRAQLGAFTYGKDDEKYGVICDPIAKDTVGIAGKDIGHGPAGSIGLHIRGQGGCGGRDRDGSHHFRPMDPEKPERGGDDIDQQDRRKGAHPFQQRPKKNEDRTGQALPCASHTDQIQQKGSRDIACQRDQQMERGHDVRRDRIRQLDDHISIYKKMVDLHYQQGDHHSSEHIVGSKTGDGQGACHRICHIADTKKDRENRCCIVDHIHVIAFGHLTGNADCRIDGDDADGQMIRQHQHRSVCIGPGLPCKQKSMQICIRPGDRRRDRRDRQDTKDPSDHGHRDRDGQAAADRRQMALGRDLFPNGDNVGFYP